MSDLFALTESIMREAEARGKPITMEEAAAIAARHSTSGGVTSGQESRTAGAPSTQISGLTPQAYMDDLQTQTDYYESNDRGSPVIGSDAWDAEGRTLGYRPGMTDDEYAFDNWRRSEQERLTRMAARGEIHPGQELGYTGPEAFDQWKRERAAAGEADLDRRFSEAGAQRHSSPGPRGFDNRAATPRRFGSVEESAAYDERKPIVDGNGVTTGVLPSQRDYDEYSRGRIPVIGEDGTVGYGIAAGPYDPLSNNRGDQQLGNWPNRQGAPGRLGARPDLEAAGWVPVQVETPFGNPNGEFGATSQATVYRPGYELRQQMDDREFESRYGRMTLRAGISYDEAEGVLDEAREAAKEELGQRELPVTEQEIEVRARAIALQKLRGVGTVNRGLDKQGRQRRVAMNAMLNGRDSGQNAVNAFDMLGDQGEFGLTANQQRALQYMLPGGQRAAEVDANNMRAASEMAASSMRGLLGPMVAASMQGGADAGTPVPFSDAWRTSPQQQDRLKQMVQTYGEDTVANRGDMVDLLRSEEMGDTQAELAAGWAFDNYHPGNTWNPFD